MNLLYLILSFHFKRICNFGLSQLLSSSNEPMNNRYRATSWMINDSLLKLESFVVASAVGRETRASHSFVAPFSIHTFLFSFCFYLYVTQDCRRFFLILFASCFSSHLMCARFLILSSVFSLLSSFNPLFMNLWRI